MVVADSRQFLWIAEEFATVMDPQTERLVRYLAHLTALGIMDCRNPVLAAHQFLGMLNELSLWPRIMGREGLPVSAEDAVEETVGMFLQRYRRPQSKGHGHAEGLFAPGCLAIPLFLWAANDEAELSRRWWDGAPEPEHTSECHLWLCAKVR